MIITKENMVDLQEKFENVKKLIEEDSRFDPETEPYFSKYAARQNLINMNAIISKLVEKHVSKEGHDYYKLIGMQAAVQLQLGVIAVDTEELSIGEQHLNDCAKIIENYEELPEVASVTLNMYNQLGCLLAKSDPDKGQFQLEKAETFYKLIKEQKKIPYDCHDLFIVNYELEEKSAMEKFEKIYTLTLYYLAQIYGPIDSLKSAVYCHKTLQRQLESFDYEPIDWALNTATLSQFLMEKNGFKQARHHLAASLYMLEEHEKVLDAITEHNDAFDAKMEIFNHRSADIARCWAKYGLILLVNSRDRLMDTENIDVTASVCTDISKLKLEADSSLTIEDLENMDFPSLHLDAIEMQVTDSFVLTIDDAKLVFLNAQKWLNKATEYYRLDNLASDFIEIAQEHAKLYDSLVFFEENSENRTKLIKRAIDVLESVVKEVNPTYYLHYCRQIWFRLGLFYSDILDIKLDKLKENETRSTPHALLKINSLCLKSTNNFKLFLDSFLNNEKVLPKKIQDDVEKAFLQAYFQIAALSTRYITLDKNAKIQNTENSLSYYKKLVDYCKLNEKAEDLVKAEMSIAKEMVMLLPLKLARMRNELPAALG